MSLQLRYAQISLNNLQTPIADAAIVTPADYETYAWNEAVKHGVDPVVFTQTLQCESGFNPDAVGDHGTSFGVAQIHLPAHPEVSRENALDPIWSIDFAVLAFKNGHANWWSCFRHLYGPSEIPG